MCNEIPFEPMVTECWNACMHHTFGWIQQHNIRSVQDGKVYLDVHNIKWVKFVNWVASHLYWVLADVRQVPCGQCHLTWETHQLPLLHCWPYALCMPICTPYRHETCMNKLHTSHLINRNTLKAPMNYLRFVSNFFRHEFNMYIIYCDETLVF